MNCFLIIVKGLYDFLEWGTVTHEHPDDISDLGKLSSWESNAFNPVASGLMLHKGTRDR